MKTANIPWPDKRRMRADALASMTFRAIERYLDRSEEALDANVNRLAHRALFDLFYNSGAEVVTDLDRASAGVPPRDAYGYTAEEMQIMEAHMRHAMMQPLTAIVKIPGLEP